MRDIRGKAVRLGFRRQIIALSLFGMFALTLTGSIAAAFLVNQKLSDNALNQGHQIASALAHQSILSLMSDLVDNASDGISATLRYSNIRGVAIFDKHGNLLVNAGERKIAIFSGYSHAFLPFEALLTDESDEMWELTAAVYDTDVHDPVVDSSIDHLYENQPKLLGYVSVLVDKTSLYKIQAELLKDSLLVFVGMALALMLVSVVVSRQMTMPLHHLASLMKRAKNGEDGIRSDMDGPVEVYEMANAFNSMMDALEQRKKHSDEQHLSLLHEIDERQLVECNLRESEHRLSTIFNNVVDGMLILDESGVIESANPTAELMLETAMPFIDCHYGEVIRKLLVDRGPPIPMDIDKLLKHCTGGCHFAIKKGDGFVDIDSKFSVMQINGIDKYIVIIRDITETQQQKNRIELLLSQHKAVVSSVPGIMMELDKKGLVRWFNKHAENVFGHLLTGHEEMVSISRFVAVSEFDNVEKCMEATFRLGKSEIHIDLLTLHGAVPYQFNMASLKGHGDEETLLLIGLDDSQSIMAQKALQKARDVALESAKLKSEFLANMSHEIRTPMNGMFGMLQLILGGDLGSEQKRYAEIALRSADQLLHIINDILDFSKIEAGKLEMLQVEVSPRTLIEDLAELFSQRADAKGVKFYSKVETDVPDIIYGDPIRLNQIISNLISNAIKFTDEGYILICCVVEEVMLEQSRHRVLRICVRDTGVGIDAGLQEHIFESFVQGDGSSTRRHSGTGLGLAIVKQLVGLMGGEISLTSGLQQGSEFTVKLPLTVPDSTFVGAVNQVVPIKFSACYVGDDEMAASILHDYLKPSGYGLDVVSIDHIRNGRIDLQQYALYFVDYDPCDYESVIAQLAGRPVKVVVMINQIQKADGLTYPAEVELYKLVKPIRYHALNTCLRDMSGAGMTDSPLAVTVVETEVIAPKQRLRLLVVEDNEVNLRVIEAMLHKLGYASMSVRNGREAVEQVGQQRFDIILMDCQMPIMDGYQATVEIRKGAGRGAVIIAMTGNAMEGDRQRCLAAGMNDYISKPIRLTALAEVLLKWSPEPLHQTLELHS